MSLGSAISGNRYPRQVESSRDEDKKMMKKSSDFMKHILSY